MVNLPGFQHIHDIEINPLWSISRAVSLTEQQIVLLKVFQYHSEYLIHEFEMTKDLNIEGVLSPIKLKKNGNETIMIAEDFSGQTLESIICEKELSLNEFLQLAIKITAILSELHQQQIIHTQIQPKNILVSDDCNKILITGFYQAIKLKLGQSMPVSEEIIGGIAYIAPEQTGMMKRKMDHRSDLYSLGVIFYEMLTDKLPFQESDHAESIHLKLAKLPSEPIIVNKSIPEMLSKMIMKLLTITPEARYQSAAALLVDLEKCLREYRLTGKISEFQLGELEISPSIQKKKLYGRDKELLQLQQLFEEVLHGNKNVVFVKGNPGSGKTSLIANFISKIDENNVSIIAGKFDQLKRPIPYSPILNGLKNLVKQIISKGEEEINYWNKRILNNLNDNTSYLMEILPELRWIIGEQKATQRLNSHEEQNRLLLAFCMLFECISTQNKPLIFFIDDVQWADRASIELIQYLVKNISKGKIFFLFAYREEEMSEDNIMAFVLDETGSEINTQFISVKPLEIIDVQQWLKDYFLLHTVELLPFSQLFYQVSKGNPFVLQQMLIKLVEEQVVTINDKTTLPIFDLQKFKNIAWEIDIQTIIHQRAIKLPKETQTLLKTAACIGSEFCVDTLATVDGMTVEQANELLLQAIEEGIIVFGESDKLGKFERDGTNKEEYRFVHDTIQQVIYSMLSDQEKQQIHLRIGRILLEKNSDDIETQELFDIVAHINIGRGYVEETKKMRLVHLNALAGEKAMQTGAFEAALTYFQVAKEELPANAWDSNYDLTLKVTIGLGESEYLNSKFTDAEFHFNEALKNAKTRLEKLRIYNLVIVFFHYVNRWEEAVQIGLTALQMFGIKLNAKPKNLLVAKELINTKIDLIGKKPKQLLELPKMQDEEKRQIMQTFINMNAPAYMYNKNLATLLMLKALRYTLKHGDTDISALTYNNYALILSAGFGQINESYAFGCLAIEHVNRSQILSLKTRVNFVYGSFVNHWKNPIHYTLDALEKAQKYGIESGNLLIAGACTAFIPMILLIKGDHLLEIKNNIMNQIKIARQFNYMIGIHYNKELLHWIDVLMNDNIQPDWNMKIHTEDDSSTISHYTFRIQMAYYLNDHFKAEECLQKLITLIDKTFMLVMAPEYYFYHALWECRFIRVNKKDIKTRKKTITSILKRFKKWSQHSPTNYLHMYFLVKAEFQSTITQNNDVDLLYDSAIEHAKVNGYLHDYALANECAMMHFIRKGRNSLATIYLKNAIDGYEKWGAIRKVRELKKNYAKLIVDREGYFETSPKVKELLDIQSIVKATQTFSQEIVLEKLLMKMIKILLENAGAEKGFLFLKKKEILHLMAKGSINGVADATEIIQWEVFGDEYPVNLIKYVKRTEEPLCLEHAAQVGLFVNDSYIKENNVKSVLCLPIISQNKLLGIVYLENNLSTHAFTEERINTLSILAAQAAISIQNAFLFGNLESLVQERTIELELANHHLSQANEDLAMAEVARRELLSNISHDLRTPITSIHGYIEAITKGIVNSQEEVHYYLHRIQDRIFSLNRLINDLFDLAQLESGRMNFSFEVVTIDKLLNHLTRTYELDVKKEGLTFKVKIPNVKNELFPLVEVDVARIDQVLSNIISNAIKNTEAGSIDVQLDTNKLSSGYVTIIIHDSGYGIPEEEISLIFNRAYTKSRNSSKQGHGLGLAICKEIIHAHNGDIWAESKLGEGTSIYIELPVVMLDNEEIQLLDHREPIQID